MSRINPWVDIERPVGKAGPPIHYKIIRYLRDEHGYKTVNGKRRVTVEHIYDCECNYCHEHFEMPDQVISRFPERTGCQNCRATLISDKRLHTFSDKNIGSFIGGCRVVRRVSPSGERHPLYEFECPFCHSMFTKRFDAMRTAAKEYPDRNLDCGCRRQENYDAGRIKAKITRPAKPKKQKIYVRRVDAILVQYLNRVYDTTQIKGFIGKELSKVRIDNSQEWFDRAMYNHFHEDKLPVNGRGKFYTWDYTTEGGNTAIVAHAKLFPYNPDNTGVPVNTYKAYLERFVANIKAGIKTTVIDDWYFEKDFEAVGINLAEIDDLVDYITRKKT